MDVSYDNVVGVSKMETELSSPNSIQTKKKKKVCSFFLKVHVNISVQRCSCLLVDAIRQTPVDLFKALTSG